MQDGLAPRTLFSIRHARSVLEMSARLRKESWNKTCFILGSESIRMSQLLRIVLVIGLTSFLSASASAAIDLGDADEFALLAMPDGSDEPDVRLFSSARVVGDVGVGEDGFYRAGK